MLGVADPDLDGAELEVGAHRPPHLGELDDGVGAHEELDVLPVGAPAAERVGDPAAGKVAREALCAGRMQTGVAPVEVGGVGGHGEQLGKHRSQAIAHAYRAVDVANPDVDVETEGVVAPGHILQALLDAAVVLGVDDRLLAVVGPRMGPRRRQTRLLPSREGEQAPSALALEGEGFDEGLAPTGDDLDLRGDQLARDRCGEQGVTLQGVVAQLLEARDELQRGGVEDRELLLEADREVGSPGERVNCLVEI